MWNNLLSATGCVCVCVLGENGGIACVFFCCHDEEAHTDPTWRLHYLPGNLTATLYIRLYYLPQKWPNEYRISFCVPLCLSFSYSFSQTLSLPPFSLSVSLPLSLSLTVDTMMTCGQSWGVSIKANGNVINVYVPVWESWRWLTPAMTVTVTHNCS